MQALCEKAKPILNEWALRIEREGYSVSLEAVVENAFLLAQPNFTIDSLTRSGHYVIDQALWVELSLACRAGQAARVQQRQEIEETFEDPQTIDWFDAAQEITGLRNSTEASKTLRRALKGLALAIRPPQGSRLQKFLAEAMDGNNPKIPSRLVSLLKDGPDSYKKWLWFEKNEKWLPFAKIDEEA
jgi:hypothetical protein